MLQPRGVAVCVLVLTGWRALDDPLPRGARPSAQPSTLSAVRRRPVASLASSARRRIRASQPPRLRQPSALTSSGTSSRHGRPRTSTPSSFSSTPTPPRSVKAAPRQRRGQPDRRRPTNDLGRLPIGIWRTHTRFFVAIDEGHHGRSYDGGVRQQAWLTQPRAPARQ
jgi:hypothetical protein